MSDQRYTVLVVDDAQVNRRVINAILSSKGYELLEASSGEEALQVVESIIDDLDVVVTDYNMGGMNGLELLQRLQESYSDRRFARFLCSDKPPSDEDQAGIIHYLLHKPVGKSLIQTVQTGVDAVMHVRQKQMTNEQADEYIRGQYQK